MEKSAQSILSELNALANDKRKTMYLKQGVKEHVFGVNLGDIRKIASKNKPNNKLAVELWNMNIFETRIMASNLFDKNMLEVSDLIQMIESTETGSVIDELSFQTFENRDNFIELFDQWVISSDTKLKRVAWNLAIILNHRNLLNDASINRIIDFIKFNLAEADSMYQFSMNRCLCEIGIKHENFTERCISIGEECGVYKEMKVSKGCVSSYAPVWINSVRSKMKK
ncbi:MAG: DNA alkylation repair protein [Erysipelotrichaceae bacterium]